VCDFQSVLSKLLIATFADYRIKVKRLFMKDFNTYIFDLDGTLLNTLNDLAASTNHALRMSGMPERTVEQVRMFVGNGVHKLIERAVPEGTNREQIEAVYDEFRKYYMLHGLDSTNPYNGVPEMLAELKQRGKKMAIVSNKFYAATQELAHHFFGGIIDVAIGERDTIRKKPAPDTVFEALRMLEVEREGAVYVGDSDVDILTARNAGLPCISVLWGFRDRDFLLANGATTLVETPLDIITQ
jgi:HAD hydrolase, family IA, variant 1